MNESSDPVVGGWQAAHATDWNRRPVRLQHRLHLEPLFGLGALADLIARYPQDDYALVQTRRDGAGQPTWREGTLGGVDGHRAIQGIAAGSFWLNLRDVGRHSPGHAALIEAAYRELADRVPGFRPQAIKMGILISSPAAQVPYHCDLPGQALWQIAGAKRVLVYPAKPPFLLPEALEAIAYTGFEFKLGYRPEFDAEAESFDLEPGSMLTWPLNSPHRVDNGDCLNISVTTEHWTDANRRSQRMLLANGVLRHRLHWTPGSRATAGPAYWAKSALQAAWRRSRWAKSTQRAHRPIEFRLAPEAPGGVADLRSAL